MQYIVEIGKRAEVAQDKVQVEAVGPAQALSQALLLKPEWADRLVINTTLQIRVGSRPT